jgi:hypothetical protein
MPQLLKYFGKDLQNMTMEVWLSEQTIELRPIAPKWFDFIKACGSDVEGIFHDGYPIGCVGHAPFAYVNAFRQHVNVGFFYGVDLPDPNLVLQGSGKLMRHIKLFPGEVLPNDAIGVLLVEAYRDIKKRLEID